jgi:hypothetical protein
MEGEIDLSKNTEINQALKEFELKSQEQQGQQPVEVLQGSDVPKMVQLVMKWTGFKEQKQAEYVLLGFVVVAIGISLFLIFGGNFKQKTLPPPDQLPQIIPK